MRPAWFPIAADNWLGRSTLGSPKSPFYDITVGNGGQDVGDWGGYSAGPGYDMATGWGTLNLLQLAWGVNRLMTDDMSPPAVHFVDLRLGSGTTLTRLSAGASRILASTVGRQNSLPASQRTGISCHSIFR